MASYILIHGAWHAGWCWEKVTALLADQGHQVMAPDLPGHGANQKPHANVKLQDYVDCIMDCVQRCDELPILVGHSFAGILLTQLAANYPGQFKKLIYVAAYVPLSGESLLSISERFSVTGLSPELIVDKKKNSIILKTPNLPRLLYHCASPENQAFAIKHIETEPLIPLATPVKYTGFNYTDIDSLCILCEQDRAITLPDQSWMAERTAGSILSLPADHSPFISMPESLALFLAQ